MSLVDRSIDVGFPARKLAEEEGILMADHVIAAPRGKESRAVVDEAFHNLQPGVTEVHVRPAIDTPELRAITPRWTANVSDAHLVTDDWSFRAALARSGAELIGYRDLRTAQRRR